MGRLSRRAIIGLLAGLLGGILLSIGLGNSLRGFALGAIVGVLFTLSFRPIPGAYVDHVLAAAALGVPLWGLLTVITLPLLLGEMPDWTAEGMRMHLPALVAWVIYGAFLGLASQALSELANRALGPEPLPPAPPEKQKKRIVILGGGFAGMKTAESLEGILGGDSVADITLVSETNALLFTPMLAEVAGSSLEPSHISSPLRTALRTSRFVRGRLTSIDLERREICLSTDRRASDNRMAEEAQAADTTQHIAYDQLVLALGAVSNYHGMANIEKLAFNFKSLLDAIRIRNHMIEMFERADREADAAARRSMLTFVIAGGGFAGVELAGALNDFARGILADYPNLRAEELSIILVHSRDRILPELSETLGAYALKRMAERGVTFRLNARLADARPGVVVLGDGEISSQTLVWTAGTAPNPLLKDLSIAKDKRGAVLVDKTLAVPGQAGVWALGDCAAVIDAKSGKPCPPTAQFALREAKVLAKNIKASLTGQPLQGFHFDSLGALCVVGHQTACAELSVPFARGKSMRFSGLLAWLMWRGIYVGKLPGLERKVRVLVDWTIELFFPKDIVQTIDLS